MGYVNVECNQCGTVLCEHYECERCSGPCHRCADQQADMVVEMICETEHIERDAIIKIFESLGFHGYGTGGGCDAFRREFGDRFVLVAHDGQIPTEFGEDVDVYWYKSDEDDCSGDALFGRTWSTLGAFVRELRQAMRDIAGGVEDALEEISSKLSTPVFGQAVKS